VVVFTLYAFMTAKISTPPTTPPATPADHLSFLPPKHILSVTGPTAVACTCHSIHMAYTPEECFLYCEHNGVWVTCAGNHTYTAIRVYKKTIVPYRTAYLQTVTEFGQTGMHITQYACAWHKCQLDIRIIGLVSRCLKLLTNGLFF